MTHASLLLLRASQQRGRHTSPSMLQDPLLHLLEIALKWIRTKIWSLQQANRRWSDMRLLFYKYNLSWKYLSSPWFFFHIPKECHNVYALRNTILNVIIKADELFRLMVFLPISLRAQIRFQFWVNTQFSFYAASKGRLCRHVYPWRSDT